MAAVVWPLNLCSDTGQPAAFSCQLLHLLISLILGKSPAAQ